MSELVASLKEEGNRLFTAGKFAEARDKYTEGIAHEDENATLFANRAACALNLKDYRNAQLDAIKTVELDPKYAKGWARLAVAQQSLGNVPASIESWEKAIAALPKKPNSTEQRHKAQYESALKAAENAQREFQQRSKKDHTVLELRHTGDLPWDVAAEMANEQQKSGSIDRTSSVWLIHEAHYSLQEGLKVFKSLRQIGDSKQAVGTTGAIELFSNGIMMEPRSFHIGDPKFIDQYNRQLMFEASVTGAWQSGRAEEIMREAPIRLEKEGWGKVRPAISLSVRAYLMRGMFVAGMSGDSSAAERLQGEAVKILEWGAQKWANVPTRERGAVFTPTFIRSCRSMQLENYMHAFCKNPGQGKRPYSLEGLHDLAQAQLRETRADPPDPQVTRTPGFIMAFHDYPEAHALTCLALYHKYCAKYTEDEQDAVDHYQQAASNYQDAAFLYAKDDEYHCWFLNVALEMMFRGGAPLSVTLPVMEHIREGAPLMQKLWAHSALQRGGRDLSLKRIAGFEREVREGLVSGDIKGTDECVMPSWFEEERVSHKRK